MAHISKVKTAQSLVQQNTPDDDYNWRIKESARLLCLLDKGHYTYVTQWETTNCTLWDSGEVYNGKVVVKPSKAQAVYDAIAQAMG